MTNGSFEAVVRLTGDQETDCALVANATKRLADMAGEASQYIQRTKIEDGAMTIEWGKLPTRESLDEFMAYA